MSEPAPAKLRLFPLAGLFGTKRMVIRDTTITRMNEPELLFVVGHEMRHYVLNHIWQNQRLSPLAKRRIAHLRQPVQALS